MFLEYCSTTISDKSDQNTLKKLEQYCEPLSPSLYSLNSRSVWKVDMKKVTMWIGRWEKVKGNFSTFLLFKKPDQ